MPIELGPTRAVGAVDARSARPSGGAAPRPGRPQAAEPAVMRTGAIDAGEPPVDTERVAQIRQAIERGTYPVIPTRIADAIIAAGILLRSGK